MTKPTITDKESILTIEGTINPNTYARIHSCQPNALLVSASVESSKATLRAVLRELDKITNGRGAVDIAVSVVAMERRIRAAVLERVADDSG